MLQRKGVQYIGHRCICSNIDAQDNDRFYAESQLLKISLGEVTWS